MVVGVGVAAMGAVVDGAGVGVGSGMFCSRTMCVAAAVAEVVCEGGAEPAS